MKRGNISKLRESIENIAMIDHEVLTANATRLLDELVDEWGNDALYNVVDRK